MYIFFLRIVCGMLSRNTLSKSKAKVKVVRARAMKAYGEWR
jgi:hypothetical protein